MRLRSQLREFLRITPRESTNAQVVVVHVSVDTKQLLEDRTTCLHEGLWKDARSALIERLAFKQIIYRLEQCVDVLLCGHLRFNLIARSDRNRVRSVEVRPVVRVVRPCRHFGTTLLRAHVGDPMRQKYTSNQRVIEHARDFHEIHHVRVNPPAHHPQETNPHCSSGTLSGSFTCSRRDAPFCSVDGDK